MRTRRRFVFDSLEDRKLMTAGYKPDVAVVSFFGMPGMPPMVPPAPTGQPGISLVGGSTGSIGGSAGASVTPGYMNSWAMKKIVYNASGAIKAQVNIPKTTDEVVATGGVIPFETITHEFATPVTSDIGNWFWNESTGSHAIQVTVTYNDPASTTLSGTIYATVNAPSVTSTTLTGQPARAGNYLTGVPNFGLTYQQANGSSGIRFSAVIASVPSAGDFAFVQTMTKIDSTVENQSTIVKVRTPAGRTYLDALPGSNSEAMGHWLSVNQGGTWPINWNDSSNSDSPTKSTDLRADPALWLYSINVNYAFDTYLVFEPSGGISVAVSRIHWELQTTATYTGPRTAPAIITAYTNPANWTVTTNHPSPWTQTGENMVKFLNWYEIATDAQNDPANTTTIWK